MRRSQKEIDAEIAALNEALTFAPKYTKFGDNNHDQIHAQVEFLKGQVDTTAEEFEELSEGERDAIYDAERWRDGDSSEAPSAGWEIHRPKRAKK